MYNLYTYVCMLLVNPRRYGSSTAICRVGQNRIYTLYMTVCLMKISAKIIVYTPYIYIWFWPTLAMCIEHLQCLQ